MPQQNLISATLSPEQIQKLLSDLAAIQNSMPFLRDLTPEERHSLPKLGRKSLDFAERSLELGILHANALPRGLDLEEMRRDLELRKALIPITQAVDALSGLLHNAQLVSGSDAYASALVIYQALQLEGRTAGLEEALDELARRFSQKSRNDEPTTPAG